MRKSQVQISVKYPLETLSIVTIICLGLFIWVGNKPTPEPISSNLFVYGGDLSDRIQNSLQQMNEALNDAQWIAQARPDQLRFVGENGSMNKYTYAYNTLYYNDNPIISNVRNLHFEYRDERGNLLVRANRSLSQVETIGYTMLLISAKRDLMINARIKIPMNKSIPNSTANPVSLVSNLN